MPRLARHLGTGVTSLYWYYKSKDDLLSALSAEAFRVFYERIPDVSDLAWDEMLRQFFTHFRRILLEDTLLCDLVIIKLHYMDERSFALTWSRVEGILAKLRDAGFAPEATLRAYKVLSVYARGAIFVEKARIAEGMPDGFMTTSHQARPDPAVLPLISQQYRPEDESSVEADYAFGLDTIIEGLTANRRAQTTPKKAPVRRART
jgi:AcrR family transcriptional regulator